MAEPNKVTIKIMLKRPEEPLITVMSHAEFSSEREARNYFATITDNLSLTMALMPPMFRQTGQLECEITSRQPGQAKSANILRLTQKI